MNSPITPKECVPFTFFEENKAMYEKLIKYKIFDTLNYLLRRSETKWKANNYIFPIEQIIKTIMERNPDLESVDSESVNLVTLVKEAIPFYEEKGWIVFPRFYKQEGEEESDICDRQWASPLKSLRFVKESIY
jgi:hypothetical protein